MSESVPVSARGPAGTLPASTWSADGWGISLCVNGACAESIANWIESKTLQGSFQEFASAIVAAGIAAFTGSSLVGFCIAVALSVTGGTLKIWILTENQKTNGGGVCIRFLWPWIPFVSPVLVTHRSR